MGILKNWIKVTQFLGEPLKLISNKNHCALFFSHASEKIIFLIFCIGLHDRPTALIIFIRLLKNILNLLPVYGIKHTYEYYLVTK